MGKFELYLAGTFDECQLAKEKLKKLGKSVKVIRKKNGCEVWKNDTPRKERAKSGAYKTKSNPDKKALISFRDSYAIINKMAAELLNLKDFGSFFISKDLVIGKPGIEAFYDKQESTYKIPNFRKVRKELELSGSYEIDNNLKLIPKI